MKKFNKIIIIGLSLLLLLPFASFATFAADGEGEPESKNPVHYNLFKGTVKEIVSYYDRDGEEVKGTSFVFAESADGELVNFLVTDDTYMITDAEIAVGSRIIGIYDAQAPVIMIYPPQYPAVAIAVDFPEGDSIKADKFDENLISSDNMLKLNISDSTEIVHQDGTPFEDDIEMLAGRKMIVVYGVSTRSIPAQTTPAKIIILNEKIAAVPEIESDGTPATDIIVNGDKIDAPAPYADDNGTVMMPLRAVAEALGYEVEWNGETQSVTLNGNIMLTLGHDLYSSAESASIKLNTAPVLINNAYTYVPLDFFTTVLHLENVITAEREIIISNVAEGDISITITNE